MTLKIVKNVILSVAESKFPCSLFGRPRTDHVVLLEQFIRVLTSGMPWRSLVGTDFRTAHRHFIKWARSGVFKDAHRRLMTLCKRRRRDGTFLALDTSFVKSVFGTDVVGRNPTDRGRNATKVVALVDDRCLPHQLAFVAANVSDHKCLPYILPFPTDYQGSPVYADKGFDSLSTREEIKAQRYVPCVSKRAKEVPKLWLRRRQVVERFFSALDKCRRLILRYDATIASYEAWTWLGSCRILGNYMRRHGLTNMNPQHHLSN